MYRLYCMDCREGAREHIESNTVDLIITDPPYGIGGEGLHRHYNRDERHVIDGYVEVDASDYYKFSCSWIAEAGRVLRPGGSIYIISGYSNLADILLALRRTSLTEVNHLIWKYNFGVHTTRKYVSSHYHILYYIKPGGDVTFNTWSRFGPGEKDSRARSKNYADREDVLVINREYKPGRVKNKNELPHALLVKLLQYSSNEGDLVADFFLGGFSTAETALGLNRRIVGFEINQVSYKHHFARMGRISPGHMLATLRSGEPRHLKNQRKKWSSKEKEHLNKRYRLLREKGRTKKEAITELVQEFQRGFFAILNKIDT